MFFKEIYFSIVPKREMWYNDKGFMKLVRKNKNLMIGGDV